MASVVLLQTLFRVWKTGGSVAVFALYMTCFAAGAAEVVPEPTSSRPGQASEPSSTHPSLTLDASSPRPAHSPDTPGSYPAQGQSGQPSEPKPGSEPQATVVHHYHHFDRKKSKRADRGFHPFKTLEDVELQMEGLSEPIEDLPVRIRRLREQMGEIAKPMTLLQKEIGDLKKPMEGLNKGVTELNSGLGTNLQDLHPRLRVLILASRVCRLQ